MGPFVSSIEKIRERARSSIEQGALTPGYRADQAQVVKVLNEVLATELVCALRYKRHYYMAQGLNAEAVKEEFAEHAREEREHADMIAARITQLNGEPDLSPEGLAERAHSDYVEGGDLVSMIKEDLIAERIAIEMYGEIVRWLGDEDPTSRRMMEQVLEKEEEHAQDLVSVLGRLQR
jgi:bacterioferritin